MIEVAQPFALHVFILCWPGYEDSAHNIAAAVEGHADHLTVLYKNDDDRIETGPGNWKKIPSEWYYGSQFRETLDLRRGDIMLHIQADASYSDWPELIR
ncbi:MAG TPA: hypothetical protein VM899_09780, partial [Rubellimicrobium sp.]|nr:hypothetical protein [Rubellimicrobium sp.]